MSPRTHRSSVPLALALLVSACGPTPTPESQDAGPGAAQAPTQASSAADARAKIDPASLRQANIQRVTIGEAASDCAVPQGDWFLHISDVHLGTTVTTQDPKGDTSVGLWRATKAALRQRIGGANPPKFILCTGDLPDHAPDHGDLHTTNVTTALADLKALADSIPLIYLPGNNDSLDWDYAAFTSAAGQTPLAAAGWPGPTLNVAATGNPAKGYFSAAPVKGLRVVALNTVMFTAKYPCTHQPSDVTATCSDSQTEEVAAQLGWLEAELKAAGAAADAVLLAMHVPPGIDAFSSPATMWKEPAWQTKFLGLIDASPAKIVGLAFGHTHLDEVRRLYDASGELELVAISAPGITPGHGNNPGFKAVSYAAGFAIQDSLTWYASASSPDAGDFTYRADSCYRYRDTFNCAPGTDLRACLGDMELCTLDARMDTILQVRRGKFAPGVPGYYSTVPGIEVRPDDAAPAECPSSANE